MEFLIIFDHPAKISAEVAVNKVVIIFRYGQPGLHILADANIYALYRYRCRWNAVCILNLAHAQLHARDIAFARLKVKRIRK